ncbi:alpha-ketoglutarate dependent xanthine dioxygenase [Aspergillus californicus]
MAQIRITPLDSSLRLDSQIGAEVSLHKSMPLLDPNALSSADKTTLRAALYEHNVLVIRDQQGIDPAVLPQIGKLFDDTACDIHSGGRDAVRDPKNILAANRSARIPDAPQVSVIGQGDFRNYRGIDELALRHLNHTEFHNTPLSDEDLAASYTRPYRWHMDAPLYETLPGRVTTLHCIETPSAQDQKIRFEDGEELAIAAGATAFFSGARNFQLLDPNEQEFALNTTVQYAPRAYEWIRDCKASNDGLTIASVGLEKGERELQDWTWDRVHSFPMVWRNHGNGQPHLQILGCCVYSLTTRDPKTGSISKIEDLMKAREICHRLQRKVYRPENIYAHRWRRGDLVVFYNQGVLHSITGQLDGRDKRLFWQCSMASGTPPVGYGEVKYEQQ